MALPPLSPAQIASWQKSLLGWFAKNRRSLPWRENPTPYQVWVSEIMLQQTRVEVVRDYYTSWMQRFPTIEALADAEEEEVLRLWQGLGYYSRARRLHQAARYLVEHRNGELPDTLAEIQEVPGIGPYSAGAILSIAYQKQTPLVDGNVIRVLTRLLALEGDPAKAPLKNDLWELAARLVPARRPGDFNQALMELGALVCTPRNPLCVLCPFRQSCGAWQAGTPQRFPEKPAAKKATEVDVLVLLVRHRGSFAVEKLSSDARWWAGLTAFPSLELSSHTGDALSLFWTARWAKLSAGTRAAYHSEEQKQYLVEALFSSNFPQVQLVRAPKLRPSLGHQVTRFKIRLHPVLVELTGKRPQLPQHVWLSPEQLLKEALPAPHKKIAQALRAKDESS